MQIGMGSYAYRWSVGTGDIQPASPWTIDDLIDEVAELDCSVLQLADSGALDGASESELARLKSHADERGVSLQTGTSGLTEERLRKYIDISVALGADVLRIVLHDENVDPSVREAVKTLKGVEEVLEFAGVTVAIENHFMTTSPDLVRIIEAVGSKRVGICVDTANSIVAGEWPAETLRQLVPYAVNAHVKDFRIIPAAYGVGGRLEGRRLGEGWLDLDAVLTALQRRDNEIGCEIDLAVILEHWLDPLPDEVERLDTEHDWRIHAVSQLNAALAAGHQA